MVDPSSIRLLPRAMFFCALTVAWNVLVGGAGERARRAEHLALRLAGSAFIVIALHRVIQATRSLVSSSRPSASLFGVAEAAGSLALLPLLAHATTGLHR